ncbi:MAG: S1C family serine protease [Gammaproteobacteria bacterium]
MRTRSTAGPAVRAAVPRRQWAACLAAVFTLSAVAAAWPQESALDAGAQALSAVVGIRAKVPETARTVSVLGTERAGSGVLIDGEGLVLTIGYLILEAAEVNIVTEGNRTVPAQVLAYDHDTGFGLVRALAPLGVKPMKLGRSASLKPMDKVLVSSYGGPAATRAAVLVSRRDFAGWWEYLLEDALFTSPPHPMYGGAALIGSEGELLGIGSLMVGDASDDTPSVPGNMFVPIDELGPRMGALLADGRSYENARPWLGLYTQEALGHLIVSRVAADGPAERAGLEQGDLIVGVDGRPVATMAEFYRKVWSQGEPGVTVRLDVLKDTTVVQIDIVSGDRYDWLHLDPAH